MKALCVILLLIASVAECLKLYRVHIPHYKLSGEDAALECGFELGRDRLYAVKWYKDNEEFFRYVPRFNPSIHTHEMEGVTVDAMMSNEGKVVLKSVNVRSTGVYRCEVSAEAPSFSSVMGEGRMTVVYLPKEGPQIVSNFKKLREEYQVGDILDLNCTSSSSFPPAKISWYINDSPVPHHPEPSYYETSSETGHVNGHKGHSNTLIKATSRRLQLQLSPKHFGSKGTAKVRCVAQIFPLFWQDGDEKVVVGNNRKTNDVDDYTVHDALQHHQEPKAGGGFLYKREALVQIRGSGAKVGSQLLLSLILTMSSILNLIY